MAANMETITINGLYGAAHCITSTDIPMLEYSTSDEEDIDIDDDSKTQSISINHGHSKTNAIVIDSDSSAELSENPSSIFSCIHCINDSYPMHPSHENQTYLIPTGQIDKTNQMDALIINFYKQRQPDQSEKSNKLKLYSFITECVKELLSYDCSQRMAIHSESETIIFGSVECEIDCKSSDIDIAVSLSNGIQFIKSMTSNYSQQQIHKHFLSNLLNVLQSKRTNSNQILQV